MKIGMIGLGRMGLNMVRRLRRGGHEVVAMDRNVESVRLAEAEGAAGTSSPEEFLRQLPAPRAVWIMVPSGPTVDRVLESLAPGLQRGDTVVDGGNSRYTDSQDRAARLAGRGVDFLDAGTSGGVWGLEVGYCLMVGGAEAAFARLEPVFRTLAPEKGYAHVGPSGAGHFAKMVHNGIEYGMLQAYGEGFALLKAASFGYDLGRLAGLWNQGSVVRSWLLELAERAFKNSPQLDGVRGYVEDSGEGRWTVDTAVALGVPAPVLAFSLMARFRSRESDNFSDKVIAALRKEFGGHAVKS